MAMHGWTAVVVGLSGWSMVSVLLALTPALTPARVVIGPG
jgi:hypothetical protein